MKNNKTNLTIETLTKDIPFEEVLPLIKNMISSIANSARGIHGIEKEDLEQELAIKAFTSWQTWDPSGGTKFSTYVYDVLMKHRNYLIRMAKTQRRNGGMSPLSLDGANFGDRGDIDPDPCPIYNFCADESGLNLDEHVYMLEIHETIEKVFRMQSDRAQAAIGALLEGMTQEAVSKQTGITQSQVSYYLKIFRTKLREEFEKKGFDLPFAEAVSKSPKKAGSQIPDLALAGV